MASTRHILVALDFTPEGLTESGSFTLEQAVGLARLDSEPTKLTLVHILAVSSRTRKKMESNEDSESRQYFQKVQSHLARIQSNLAADGLEVETRVLFGKTWLTLIREVLRLQPSLLLAGAARRKPFLESLFGSTTLKLLRKCPCPVWVTKKLEKGLPQKILVAHDLREVGSQALRWGIRAAELYGAQLHILHVLEVAGHDSLLHELPHAVRSSETKKSIEHIEGEIQGLDFVQPPEIVVTDGQPQLEIFRYVQQNGIDLLTMGTLGRGGVAGFVTGNTAEFLLPWIPCSLIALKPDDFESPVKPV